MNRLRTNAVKWGAMAGELYLNISEDDADAERLATLARYLRAELLHLDVEGVAMLPGGEPPPHSRAATPAAVGSLLVTLGQSAEGLVSVVSAIRDWLRRGGQSRVVRLELPSGVLELSQASEADQERLIEFFISQHRVWEGGQWAASVER
jgi:hypothetical protein